MKFYPDEPAMQTEKEQYICRIAFSSNPVLVHLAGILLVNAAYILMHLFFPHNSLFIFYQLLLILWVVFLYFLFHTIFSVLLSRITVTNKLIFGRRFAYWRIHFDIRLQDITQIKVYSFGFGKLFDYGILRIRSANQMDYWLYFVKSPRATKKLLDDLCLPNKPQGKK